ncbi:MAG: BlaI/MecI/CopY family transcriptional regulator [Myxococcales bacterium FL481]|nr:MAG: BlaI/MecI/CopY family transcriptional regulator [Myxococcales bacterium FL481]
MADRSSPDPLTRRERQIMDVLYQQGRATAARVRELMPDAPSYSTVRALLRLLEQKGHARHTQDGPRYVYSPKRPRGSAGRAAAKRLLDTFFAGSVEQAMSTLFDVSDPVAPEELDRLTALIERARKEGR